MAWFALGAVYVLGRHRIEARPDPPARSPRPRADVVDRYGKLYLLLGALWLVSAFL
jgi:hypothetical protein